MVRRKATWFTTAAVLAAVSIGIVLRLLGNPDATAVPKSSLKVSAPEDGLGLGNRIVFSTVKNEARAGKNVTLSNPTAAPVQISKLTFGGPNGRDFELCDAQPPDFVIAPGANASICVQYRPTVDASAQGNQVSVASLTIASSAVDVTKASDVVTLGGINTEDYESYHEPNLQQVFNALGYKDNAGVTDWPQKDSISASSTAVGDEVLAPYWKALDTASPVQLIPVAHYEAARAEATDPFGWYSKGSTKINNLYALAGGADGANNGYGQNQLLMPTIANCAGCSNRTSFNTNTSFGLTDNFKTFVSKSDDALNDGRWHNWRFYPAKDSSGKVIAGTYLVGDDFAGPINNSAKNWDYQDFAFVLTNVTPDTSSAQPTAGVTDQTLTFDGKAGGVDDTGFTGDVGATAADKISVGDGALKVTTSPDSVGTHTNALSLGVNSGDAFIVQSRIVGPFDALDAGEEQQGVFLGPDGKNYLRLSVEWDASDKARHVAVWQVVNGRATKLSSAKVPGDVKTLDLQIAVDSSSQAKATYNSDALATVKYSINDGAFEQLGATNKLPDAWITANTPAGVMTSSNGGSPFTATYAGFSVTRNK